MAKKKAAKAPTTTEKAEKPSLRQTRWVRAESVAEYEGKGWIKADAKPLRGGSVLMERVA